MNQHKHWWITTPIIAISVAFLVNSILFTWSITRRSADDLVKINTTENEKDKICRQGGGKPYYNETGKFSSCVNQE